jgi:hypothetical protein
VGVAPYDTSHTRFENRFESARFMTMLQKRFDPLTTYEIRGGAGRFTVDVDASTEQFDKSGNRTLLQTTVNDITDRSWNVAGKVARRWGETHNFSTGLEYEDTKRVEKPLTIVNGVPQLAGFGAEFDVSTERKAAWLQDEWDPNPKWSTSLGVRWEEIVTKGQDENAPVRNTSRVVNPLAHMVWRFDAPKRDQLRLSLTQSYRAPPTLAVMSGWLERRLSGLGTPSTDERKSETFARTFTAGAPFTSSVSTNLVSSSTPLVCARPKFCGRVTQRCEVDQLTVSSAVTLRITSVRRRVKRFIDTTPFCLR